MTDLSRRALLGSVAGAAALAAVCAPAPEHAEAAPLAPALPLVGPSQAPALHVMSFNVRYDKEGTHRLSRDYWPRRLPVVQELLRAERPDLLGTQEALHHQLPALREALPDTYRMLGEGRDGGTDGEYSAVFYDSARFAVGAWGQRWISDTPDVPSPTYGSTLPRVVVWARLTDTATGRELLWLNTHLDNVSAESRRRGAQMMLALRDPHPGLPVVVTGDFNSAAGSSVAWDVLVGQGGLADSWAAAAERVTPEHGTFTDYKRPRVGGDRIDWVLVDGVVVERAAINTWRKGLQAPSDHAAVQARVRLA